MMKQPPRRPAPTWWPGWRRVYGQAPKKPGVYAVIEGSRLAYIGAATNLWARLHAHGPLMRLRSIEVWIHECENPFQLEGRMIWRLMPYLNRTAGSPGEPVDKKARKERSEKAAEIRMTGADGELTRG